jgi:hypothetical protein
MPQLVASKYLLPACVLVAWLACQAAPSAAADPTVAKPVSYRLVSKDGRLVMESSRGERLAFTCYGVSSEQQFETWAAKQHVFLDAGVRLFQLTVWPTRGNYWSQPFWSLDGQPVTEPRQGVTLGEQAAWLLERQPEARFFIRFGLHPDPEWRRAHPAEFAPLLGKAGTDDPLSIMPSLASQAWATGVERLLRDTVGWCEAQPWRDRIVGYSIFPYCEGLTEVGVFGDMFDTSPVMQEAFRDFVRERHADDAALRAAWNDDAVSLATVTVPTKAEWLAKRQAKKIPHFPDPAQVRRERDYFDLQERLFHRFWTRVFDLMVDLTRDRPVIKGYDILKQPMLGWLHDPSFLGRWEPGTFDSYGCGFLATGSIGVATLLDHPGIDLVQTPGAYDSRAMGYAWDAEGVTDSLVLRGKQNYLEADMRTWVSRDHLGKPVPLPNADAGTLLTPAEMRAGFSRTLAWALSRNQSYYYMSVWSGNWWYDDPVIGAEVALDHRRTEASMAKPWRDTEHAICMVLDDRASQEEDFSAGLQHMTVRRQIEDGLALAGLPYRVHLLDDLAHPAMPAYRCYLFPNLYKVTPETVALLRRTVLRDGNVVIFGPATGITDGRELSAKGATDLLGLPMELRQVSPARRVLLQDRGHPISRRLATTVFGCDHGFGPLLVPAQWPFPEGGPVTPLGATFYHYFLDRGGLLVREAGRGGRTERGEPRGPDDYAVVFSPAVPLPPDLLRECARHGGAHVWSEQNAVVYASDRFVSLHSVRRGPHTIHLPRPARVRPWDTPDAPAGPPTQSISLDLESPATVGFWLDPVKTSREAF